MADLKMSLTDKVIEQLAFAEKGRYLVRDDELKGFFVMVGRLTKTFMVQGEFWQNGARVFATRAKVGECDELTCRSARAKARDILVGIAKGVRPGAAPEPESEAAAPTPGVTLRQAWDRYRIGMERKERSAGTIANYRDHVERLMEDWLDESLGKLGATPSLVVERHDLLTEENGPYIANGAMRSLRAIYNHAADAYPDLPQKNPVKAIDWNKEKRRDTGIGSDDVVSWLYELHAHPNSLRREFHLMTLLSGSRPTALKTIRIADINFRDRLLHIPKPKGGGEKAFDIPLSRLMIQCMLRTMRIGREAFPAQARIWLFPAESESGHLEEHKENRPDAPGAEPAKDTGREKVFLSKWGNDLRQTYRNLAQVAGVGDSDIHLLMNHSLPGVNGGYLTRDRLTRNHLRAQQERISAVVLDQVGKAKTGALARWLNSSRIETKLFRSVHEPPAKCLAA